MRTQEKVCDFFNSKYPDWEAISQCTVSRIEKKFREADGVKYLPKRGRKQTSEDNKVYLLLTIQENSHIRARQVDLDNNMDHMMILKKFKTEKVAYVQNISRSRTSWGWF